MKVILIGGSPCSGKSSVAEKISKKYNYQHIKVDDYMGKHIDESNRIEHPIMFKWKTEPWHELFSRNVDIQVKEELEFYNESWDLLVRDIRNSIHSENIVIEGCALIPSRVSSLFERSRIVYMVPSEDFQVKEYNKREWAFDILKNADDVQLAFDRWMERDIEFARIIKKNAEKLGFDVLVNDGTKSINQIITNIMG